MANKVGKGEHCKGEQGKGEQGKGEQGKGEQVNQCIPYIQNPEQIFPD